LHARATVASAIPAGLTNNPCGINYLLVLRQKLARFAIEAKRSEAEGLSTFDRNLGMMASEDARAAIELRAGRALMDAEWAAMRARLLEFAGILRDWDRKTTASQKGNVEVLCQREP
jgi:hypothetical protein